MDKSIFRNPELASHRRHFIKYMKRGRAYMKAQRFETALRQFQLARKYARKLAQYRPLVLSRCYMFMADVYQLKGEHARATRFYHKSIHFAGIDRRVGVGHKHIAWLKARMPDSQ